MPYGFNIAYWFIWSTYILVLYFPNYSNLYNVPYCSQQVTAPAPWTLERGGSSTRLDPCIVMLMAYC